jgi:uncharacterized protein YjeT (DUF2065 family)
MNIGINWADLLRALALLAIMEGVLPFLNPEAARAALRKVADLEAAHLRIMGLVLMAIGCLVLLGLRA